MTTTLERTVSRKTSGRAKTNGHSNGNNGNGHSKVNGSKGKKVNGNHGTGANRAYRLDESHIDVPDEHYESFLVDPDTEDIVDISRLHFVDHLSRDLESFVNRGDSPELKRALVRLEEEKIRPEYFLHMVQPYFFHNDTTDLVTSVILGLIDADEKYDPNEGRFITWAREHIQNRLNLVAYDGWNLRNACKVPRTVWDYKKVFRNSRNKLHHAVETPKGPTNEDVAKAVNDEIAKRRILKEGEKPTKTKIRNYWDEKDEKGNKINTSKINSDEVGVSEKGKVSIDQGTSDYEDGPNSDFYLGDSYTDNPLETLVENERVNGIKNLVRENFSVIKEEWKDILKLKYGLHNQIDRDTIRIRYRIYIDEGKELTFEQIAEIYDVSKQNVQQKERVIFNHIRKYRAAKDLGLLDSEKEESEIIKLKHGFHTDKDREVFEQKYGLKIQPGDKISIREIAKLQEIPYRLVKDKERGTNQVIKEYLEAA